jgi:septal ring factor EnvC (AmiA/AmiB activator)
MTKMGFFTKVKLAKAGSALAKHSPKLAMAAAAAAVLYYAYTFMVNQQEQLKTLQETVQELRTQNSVIIDANQALDADMKVIKSGVETFNGRLIEINQSTRSLERKINDRAFQELLQRDLPKAELKFNEYFNEYLKGINDDTLKFAK